jgi:hypothetical protein
VDGDVNFGGGVPQSMPPTGIPYQAATISDRPGWIARMLGARFREDRGYRMKWGEWSWSWGLSLELINFGEDGDWSVKMMLGYGKAFVSLPFLPKRDPPSGDMLENWGFTWNWDADTHGADIHLNWGARSKIVHMPWSWGSCVRHDMLCADGVWRKFRRDYDLPEGEIAAAVETHPYRYVCRDGTIQDTKATISVDEMEWRWRGTRWLPWPRMIRRTIDVQFDAETGERRGSWKGGVLGCSYEMKRGETPLETLRRMQRHRRFD